MNKKVEKGSLHTIDSSLNKSQLIGILDYISQSITVFDKNGNVLFCNAKAIDLTHKLFGIRLKGGENVFDFLVPAYQHKFRELMLQALQGHPINIAGKPGSLNGFELWFEFSFFPVSNNDGIIDAFAVSCHDITNQKTAEKNLVESEARYKTIIQDQTELICRYLPSGVLTFVNKAYCNFFGKTEEFLLGKCWYDFLPPFIHEKVIENINKLNIENPINRYNQMVLNGNGSLCWLACTDIAVFDDSGSILEIQSVGKDITEQVKLETELKVSKQKAEAILKAIPDLMFVYDIDGKIVECYASDTSQLLAPAEMMISKNLRDFLPDDLTLEAYEKIKICIETDSEQTIDYSLIINGSKQYYEAKFVKFEDDKVLSISRNITRKKQTEEKLIQSEEMYRKLVNTLPDAVIIVTLDHRILFASPKALQLFGCSDPSEYLGTQAGDWIEDKYISLAREIVGNLEQGKENMFTQVSLKRKDGSTFIGDVNAGTVSNREGKIWGFLLVIRDVTIRKQFEDQIRLLYTAVEQSPVSVIITDTSGKIEYVNSNFAINTGYSESEVIGKNPSILKSGLQSKEVYEHLWSEISQGRDWKGEFINKRKDGTLFWEAVSISPVKNFDGSITNYLAVKEDITDRKRVEQELIDAKNKAEESDRLKTAFLANISHEIRTPMNGIVGFASLLNDSSLPHEKIQEYTTIIQNGCNRLLSIITDMVDISKIEAGIMQTNKSTVELNSLVCDLKLQFQRLAMLKGIDIRVCPDERLAEIPITTDVTKLTQVITNLLSNAIKFSENNFVDVGFNLKDHWIEFMIKDMGVGISPEHHQLIFDRFWQVRSHSRQNVEGMGLGLSISKSMVEQMGGKIWLESQPGKGTTFYFRIPFEPATVRDSTQDAKHKKIDYRQCFEKKCILIAEDEDINFKYLRTILEKAGANVIHAKNGETAVIATMTHVPDLVLMDMKMPVMNGIDATRIIRKRFPKMPIIAITAFTMEHDKEKTMQAGCDNYISKPINEDEFFKTVGSYLMK